MWLESNFGFPFESMLSGVPSPMNRKCIQLPGKCMHVHVCMYVCTYAIAQDLKRVLNL